MPEGQPRRPLQHEVELPRLRKAADGGEERAGQRPYRLLEAPRFRMGYDFLARIGASVNAEQMHAERIDGYNPLAVIDAIARKKKILEAKNGPVLLDTVTYRFSGHSPSDASSYREKAEVDAWIKGLSGARHDAATSFFTTIRRGADGALTAVPYSQEYQGELAQAAALALPLPPAIAAQSIAFQTGRVRDAGRQQM